MRNEYEGKEIKGYSYADGVHWYWEDQEIAVINDETGDIEWSIRKYDIPYPVIDAIRERRPKPAASFRFDIQPVDISTTQCYIVVLLNGEKVMTFGDDKELVDGRWVSKAMSRKNIGRLLYETFRQSDKLKELLLDE